MRDSLRVVPVASGQSRGFCLQLLGDSLQRRINAPAINANSAVAKISITRDTVGPYSRISTMNLLLGDSLGCTKGLLQVFDEIFSAFM